MSLKNQGELNLNREVQLLNTLDAPTLRNIMMYRAMGYNQTEIAERVDVSQKTVSKYLGEVNKLAEKHENPQEVFYGVFMSLFSDKLTEVLTLLIDFSESPDTQ